MKKVNFSDKLDGIFGIFEELSDCIDAMQDKIEELTLQVEYKSTHLEEDKEVEDDSSEK